MKKLSIEEAVGESIGHELTGIVPGANADRVFKKGHVITKEDVPILKDMGKYHVHILEPGDEDLIHENEGAILLGEAGIGENVYFGEPKEGKVQVKAACNGLFIAKKEPVTAVNMIDGLMISTRWSGSAVKEDERVSVFGITPLFIKEAVLEEGLSQLKEPVVEVVPFVDHRIGMITTGTEVYEGRIKDAFLDYTNGRLASFGQQVEKQEIIPDVEEILKEKLDNYLKSDYDLIFLTGGMSVDADDVTTKVIREYPEMEVVTYGSPVLPGAMFLLAYWRDKCVVGLPAGLLRGAPSILDRLLPFMMAKKRIEKEYIASLGVGGI